MPGPGDWPDCLAVCSEVACQSNRTADCRAVDDYTCLETYSPENQSYSLPEEMAHEMMDYNSSCYHMNLYRHTGEYQAYGTFSLVMGALTFVFGGLGLLGNTVSILVLNSKDMRSNCFNNILTALNITDSLHIVFAMLEVLRADFVEVYNFLPHQFFPYFHYPALRICLCASIYLIMAVGVERYLAVCRPHHYREVQARTNRSTTYISLALGAAVTVCLPRFAEVTPVIHCVDFSQCHLQPHCPPVVLEKYHMPTALRLDRTYITYYHFIFRILVTGIIPFLILSVLNYKIYNTMKMKKPFTTKTKLVATDGLSAGSNNIAGNPKNRRTGSLAQQQHKREQNLATVLICTALTFFLLHMPRLLTGLYEAVNFEDQELCREKQMDLMPLWFLYSIVVMNILLVINSSSNILIYLFVGTEFRKQFRKTLRLEASLHNEPVAGIVPASSSARIGLTLSPLPPNNNHLHNRQNINEEPEVITNM